MEPAGITPPTKWAGPLADAYEAEVARLGGLAAAKPKPVFDVLQAAGFPDITLQARLAPAGPPGRLPRLLRACMVCRGLGGAG